MFDYTPVKVTPSYKAMYERKGFVVEKWYRNQFTDIAVQIKDIYPVTTIDELSKQKNEIDVVSYQVIGDKIHHIKPFRVFEQCYSPIPDMETEREGFIVREKAYKDQFSRYYQLAFRDAEARQSELNVKAPQKTTVKKDTAKANASAKKASGKKSNAAKTNNDAVTV